MTVAEYQQAQNDIAEIKAQIAQLRDVVAKGVPAVRGVYGMDQVEEPATNAPNAPTEVQPVPQMMSAHEQVGTPNVNPFQDDFTPNTNTVSMQEIAGQVAPQPDQPLPERLARGAMNLPIGMAAMAEQATSDPAGFAKGTGEYLATWAQRLNPNQFDPNTIKARAEWGQQAITDPVGSTLDAAGVVGTALGLPALGGKIKGFKSIKEARAAINDIGKPRVDVPEVVQEPIRSETPIGQPTSAAEVVGEAKPNAEYPHNDLSGKVLDDGSYLDRNGNTIKSGEPIEVSFAGAPPNFPRPWTYVDGENVPSTVNYKTNASIKIRAANGKEHTLERADYYAPRKSESATDIGADLEPPQRPTTATEVVAKAKSNTVTQGVKQLTPDELTAAQAKLREKFKPMDDVTKPQTPQAITEGLAQSPAKKAGTGEYNKAVAEYRKIVNKKFDSPRERADAIEFQRNLVQYYEGRIKYPNSVNETYNNGNKIGYTGVETKEGAREFIWLEGSKRGDFGYTYEGTKIGDDMKAANVKNWEDMQAGFRRLRENEEAQRAGKISTEQPTATVQDAGATPAQSTKPVGDVAKAKEPWEMTGNEFSKTAKSEFSDKLSAHKSGIENPKQVIAGELITDPAVRKHFADVLDTRVTIADETAVKHMVQVSGSRYQGSMSADFSTKNAIRNIFSKNKRPVDIPRVIIKYNSPPEVLYHELTHVQRMRRGRSYKPDMTVPYREQAHEISAYKATDFFRESNYLHRNYVRDALKQGKPVPSEVLADYPDLAAKYGKPTTAEAVVKKAGRRSQLLSSRRRVLLSRRHK